MARILSFQKVSNEVENNILIGMITSDEYCAAVMKIAKRQYFQGDFCRIVYGWIRGYYDKYGKSPGNSIKEIYSAEKSALSEADADIISRLLANLSEKSAEPVPIDVTYLIDTTKEYFRSRSIILLLDKSQDLVIKGKLDQAESYIKDYASQTFSPSIVDGATWATAIIDAATFQSLDIPKSRTFLYPIIRENQIILCSGPRGCGKTWLGLSLANAISKGEGFGPWLAAESVPCLYLDGEMAVGDINDRMAILEPAKGRLFFYSDAYNATKGQPSSNLLSAEWQNTMQSILTANGIKFFVIDNLASLASGIDENDKKAYDPINQWLIKLRFQGITTLVLHHTGKSGVQRGTSAREDNIDISILLKLPANYQTENGADFIFTINKSRLANAEKEYVQDTRFTLVKNESGKTVWTYQAVKAQTQMEVIRMLDEGMLGKDIAKELGITEGRVSQIKKQAERDGTITKDGKLTAIGLNPD